MRNQCMNIIRYAMCTPDIRPEVNSRGCVDVEKTHKKIYEADFIEILKRDYEGLNWKEIAKKTNELMKPGSFVIFKTDIDVDSLIK